MRLRRNILKASIAAVAVWASAPGSACARQDLPREFELGGGRPSPFLPADFVPDPAGAFADFAGAWPARVIGEDVRAALGEKKGVIVGIEPAPGHRVIRFSARRVSGRSAADAGAADDARTLLGDYRKNSSLRLEGPGSMLVEFETAGPEETTKREDRASMYFKFVSAQDVTPAGMPRRTLELQRTWFAYYEPARTPDDPSKPVVLVIPGMFGSPEPVVNGLVNRLRLRGWPVLRMICHPSRFTETETVDVDVSAYEPGMRRIAEILTDRAAECAYAASAAFEHLEQERPGLAARGRAAIGFSGGAMAMPTVVALEPDRYRSIVLVGGGCDFFLIAERSNYASWIDGLRVRYSGPVDAAQRRALDSAYMDAAPLDSYHTARALRGLRTLAIQGSIDRAVPSDLGDLLWERLGRGERWLDAQTHETLFLTLPMRYDAIIDWLAGKERAGGADTQSAPASP
jgi:hypothetical protein